MSGPRWKYSDAEKFALENPVSGVYDKMKCMPSIKSFFANTAMILEADAHQSELLNNACFGRPILVGPRQKISFNQGGLPMFTDQNEEIILYELGLEEAFFLCHELNCLQVCHKSKEGECILDTSELWLLMVKKKKGFLYFYKAYHHLRQRNWIVRTGHQYGTDFIAYRHHPSQVHAEFAVIVVSESDEHIQLNSWSHMQGIIRLCGSVAKTLLLLRVSRIEADDSHAKSLDKYSVQEMEVKRWLPNKNRMNSLAANCTMPELNNDDSGVHCESLNLSLHHK